MRKIRPHKGGRRRDTGRIDVVVRQEYRDQFVNFCKRKGISQADAMEIAIAWLNSQAAANDAPVTT